MIRLSTTQMYNNSMNSMLQSNSRVNNVNNQMGTGKRVLTPADDPVAAAQTLNSKTRMAIVEQYNRNTDFGDKNLSLTESVLDQTETALISLKERAIQLGSDQWSDEQIKASGVEVKEMLNHLQGLLNTRNESGEYIFAGSQAEQKAYDGNFFKGDTVEREAQVADDTFIKMLTSGARVFENLEIGADKLKPTYDPNKVIPDPDVASNFTPDATVDTNFTDAPANTVVDPAKFIETPAGSGIYAVDPAYVGADPGTVVLDPAKFKETEAGSGIFVVDETYAGANPGVMKPDPSNLGFTNDPAQYGEDGAYPNNMLGVLQHLVDATGNGNPAGPVNKEAIRNAIQNIDVAFEQVSQSRSQIGARQNTLSAVKESNTDFKDFAKQSISDLEDLDYSEAYIRLQTSMLSYQAGMQVSGKVSSLSLFDYI
ncbi:MAG TPA: flagellar hook-associated protein FlgL [Marinospirillum sp.]|uniref:flagellar hook-associated protein FlgL n=1 Tax=Marinospirillum sp. TaxID=2183934 RepID=UPI002B49AE45|nr:flagellar hook-associated protein FlgL [Marinospirillum sp.]HKM15881.1 flagellar hook-associated protein FlgL [Marinospirillum sp.]